ncbi:hypothetical protein GQ53DRAFT_771542 [Thozetella sp. PMI_491]|nr:hypothetical protein GQ53DRAFT_771542 [Thozetella sp. PMI_491]
MSTLVADFPYSDIGGAFLAPNIVLTILDTICVGLRLFARKLKGLRWGLDDYLVVAALVAEWGTLTQLIYAVKYGKLGLPINFVTEEEQSIVELCNFIFCLTYATSTSLVKLAVLALYARIFRSVQSRLMTYGTRIVGLMVIGWWIANILVTIFQCNPIPAAWDPNVEGKCIENFLFFLGNSIANAGLDTLILLLPIRDLMRLNMTGWNKVAAVTVFMLGGVVVVFSAMRIAATGWLEAVGIYNMTQQFVWPWLATTMECCVAIICACIPTLLPIVRLVISQSSANRSSRDSSNPWPSKNVMTIGRAGSRRPVRSFGASILATKDEFTTHRDEAPGHDGSFERLGSRDPGADGFHGSTLSDQTHHPNETPRRSSVSGSDSIRLETFESGRAKREFDIA